MTAKKFSLPAENNPLESSALFRPVEEPVKEAPAPTRGRGRPRTSNVVRGNSLQEGLPEDYTRATFILRVDLVEKIKDYAYTERLSTKDAMCDLLDRAFEGVEAEYEARGEKMLHRKGGK